ncbi:MAG TPA: hypothetical protein VN444_03725 [Verrucomicrobiae bacterium]|nr:hypothetical protein [Verrucomicrobiae bacterium]
MKSDIEWVLICPWCDERTIGTWGVREMILSKPCDTPGCQWTWEYIPEPIDMVTA